MDKNVWLWVELRRSLNYLCGVVIRDFRLVGLAQMYNVAKSIFFGVVILASDKQRSLHLSYHIWTAVSGPSPVQFR